MFGRYIRCIRNCLSKNSNTTGIEKWMEFKKKIFLIIMRNDNNELSSIAKGILKNMNLYHKICMLWTFNIWRIQNRKIHTALKRRPANIKIMHSTINAAISDMIYYKNVRLQTIKCFFYKKKSKIIREYYSDM